MYRCLNQVRCTAQALPVQAWSAARCWSSPPASLQPPGAQLTRREEQQRRVLEEVPGKDVGGEEAGLLLSHLGQLGLHLPSGQGLYS